MIRRWYISLLPLHFSGENKWCRHGGEGRIKEEIHFRWNFLFFFVSNLLIIDRKRGWNSKQTLRLIVKMAKFFNSFNHQSTSEVIFFLRFYERISQEFISIKENRLFLLIYFLFLRFVPLPIWQKGNFFKLFRCFSSSKIN